MTEQPMLFEALPPEAKAYAELRYFEFQPYIEKLRLRNCLAIGGYHWWNSRWWEWSGEKFQGVEKITTQDAFGDVWLLHEADLNDLIRREREKRYAA